MNPPLLIQSATPQLATGLLAIGLWSCLLFFANVIIRMAQELNLLVLCPTTRIHLYTGNPIERT